MITFNGKQYSSEKDWAAAFPAYGRHYARFVTRGADTVMKLEQAIHEAQGRARAASKAGAKRSPMNTSVKGKVGL